MILNMKTKDNRVLDDSSLIQDQSSIEITGRAHRNSSKGLQRTILKKKPKQKIEPIRISKKFYIADSGNNTVFTRESHQSLNRDIKIQKQTYSMSKRNDRKLNRSLQPKAARSTQEFRIKDGQIGIPILARPGQGRQSPFTRTAQHIIQL